ncbi:TniB family NTP-binding protein [Pseudomonas putida]|uniref:TniB family NTP-binding protein n=1 Tax=Pseudomonas putida TaxID=303 RepID=UPI0022702400|nr:TniB family NTP-binding protein [Pseudomonas putida]WAB99729.1 TniB family NTP-binding protein [Pseudomonas putida]
MTDKINQKLNHLIEFTIAHPMYSHGLQTLRRAAEIRLGGRPDSGAAIFGKSGTGKTHLCTDFIRDFVVPHEEIEPKGRSRIMPVIYCRVPSESTVNSVMVKILATMGVFLNRPTLGTLEYQLYQNLKNCKTQLLILDEFPHILKSMTENIIRAAGDWVKNLSDDFRGLILIAGEPFSEKYIDSRQAMGDRFPFRVYFEPFSLTTEENAQDFERLIRSFAMEISSSMGFNDMPTLTSEKELYALYALTSGNLRQLRNILHGACEVALKRGDKILHINDFSYISQTEKFSCRLTEHDPFSLSAKELRKIILEKTKAKAN